MRKEVVAGEPRAAAMPQIVRAEVDEEVALATAESEDDDDDADYDDVDDDDNDYDNDIDNDDDSRLFFKGEVCTLVRTLMAKPPVL